MISKELVAASSTPIILSILSRSESYGYSIIQSVRKLSAGASSVRKRRTLRTKGGEIRTVNTLSILIRDWDGEPDHVLVIFEAPQ